MPFAVKFKLDTPSLRATLARLQGVKLGRRNAILRTACNKAGRLVAKSAKQNLSVRMKSQKGEGIKRTGLLRKSIGVIIRSYENAVLGIVGPLKGYKQQIGVRTRGGAQRTITRTNRRGVTMKQAQSKKGDPVFYDPAKIAHLVENGHGGPHPAPAYPFLRPAFEQNVGRIEQIFSEEVSAGITRLIHAGKFSGSFFS